MPFDEINHGGEGSDDYHDKSYNSGTHAAFDLVDQLDKYKKDGMCPGCFTKGFIAGLLGISIKSLNIEDNQLEKIAFMVHVFNLVEELLPSIKEKEGDTKSP